MERNDDDLVALRVAAIIDGGSSGSYNLVLQEIVGGRRIIMAIGLAEAQAIAVYLEGVRMPRPLTHDLMARMIKSFGVTLTRVIIEDMSEGFFLANVVCEKDGTPFVFDARTSDAVALAIRCQAPIFARTHVVSLVSGNAEPRPAPRNPQPTPLEEMSTSDLKKKFDEAVAAERYEEAQVLKEILKKRGE